ncbi:hypothetical protein OWM54_02835 [Myxococcus sp. MISCRS1]|jgi:hypothetical protein|uniref:Uncharacterized protein n=1 Tax=Myxococcus fulvus TaxID=33 RepID=A0A511T5J5_MYXFU|nr:MULTISPECIES: hypothetical protein [Myxococcus]AKF81184.1 hypothetical protein MFUL124B02_18575 [Myxococcus fulvus 124B02]BDT33956.1 transposase family protein [Myxococcus sp. MH1]MBZ4400007.1 hypothetical protein [Myxococcus sp. AS-1-15]MBZ4412302.1 hypothetical protein [Myxococcus sp. XM-1-1-1]MCK8496753.1 hypothetical protein [Myxococcus fulvus]
MAGCAHCGHTLDIIANQVGRSDTCPKCDEDVRSCRNCRHYDASFAKECKEPFAEVPSDKDGANFCELFQIGEGGLHAKASRDALMSAAEALFRKR